MQQTTHSSLYDELLLITNATDEPRLYFRVSSRSYKPTKLADVQTLAPDDLQQFQEFYALTGLSTNTQV